MASMSCLGFRDIEISYIITFSVLQLPLEKTEKQLYSLTGDSLSLSFIIWTRTSALTTCVSSQSHGKEQVHSGSWGSWGKPTKQISKLAPHQHLCMARGMQAPLPLSQGTDLGPTDLGENGRKESLGSVWLLAYRNVLQWNAAFKKSRLTTHIAKTVHSVGGGNTQAWPAHSQLFLRDAILPTILFWLIV